MFDRDLERIMLIGGTVYPLHSSTDVRSPGEIWRLGEDSVGDCYRLSEVRRPRTGSLGGSQKN